MEQIVCHPLAAARIARRLTRVDLAAGIQQAARRRGLRSGTDKTRIRKWEVLGVQPSDESQIYIAEALGLPEDLVQLDQWPNWLPCGDDGVVPLGPYSTVPALREALRAAMERRTFLTIAGTAVIALSADWAASGSGALASAHDGKPVGEDFVALLEGATSQLTGLPTEQRQHTALLLDAHLATVTDLLDHGRYSVPIALRLHTLAASLSQTVAWYQFDMGQHVRASKYWIAGLHNAHACSDRDMGAALLGDLAYERAWRRDHGTAASILQHALSRAEHPAARSLLHLRLARTLAAQSERSAALRSLAAAEKYLGAAGWTRPAWCAWMSEADLAVDSGQCLIDLGETRRAHQLIAEGQDLLPAARDKTRSVFLAYGAESHLRLNEPELAAASATEALTLARRIGAPRCVRMVQDLLPSFEPYQRAQGVPELLRVAAA